jgi:hypothetical protein
MPRAVRPRVAAAGSRLVGVRVSQRICAAETTTARHRGDSHGPLPCRGRTETEFDRARDLRTMRVLGRSAGAPARR